MGQKCCGSKSTDAAAPALLTSKPACGQAPEELKVKTLKQYAADLEQYEVAQVRAALQDLTDSERAKILAALCNADSDTACAHDNTQATGPEALKKYLEDFSKASESEVAAALQGLTVDERARLLQALSIPPEPDSCSATPAPGISVVAELADAVQEKDASLDRMNGGEMVAADGSKPCVERSATPEMSPRTATTTQARPFSSCCCPQTEATTELAV